MRFAKADREKKFVSGCIDEFRFHLSRKGKCNEYQYKYMTCDEDEHSLLG